MLESEEGLIISDTRSSAISISSSVWAEKLNARIIYALEYSSLTKLVQALDKDYPWILFTWRGSLELILRDKFLTSRLNKICRNTVLLFSVPDHIDLTIEGRINSNPIYEYADGFTVVSRRLQDSYNSLRGKPYSPLYLPDFPNIKLLNEVQRMNLAKEPNSVIWVGNSRWGESLGFRDHKGYVSKLMSIVEISRSKSTALKFRVVDRGKAFMPHRMTLIEIAKSSILLQTSASEGTGLPVLEALALGTYPITTDVGINREVFGTRWPEFEASSPEDFVTSILSTINAVDSKDLEEIYLRYVSECSLIVTNLRFPTKGSLGPIHEKREKYLCKLGIDFDSRLRWPVRFLLNKLRATVQELKTGKS